MFFMRQIHKTNEAKNLIQIGEKERKDILFISAANTFVKRETFIETGDKNILLGCIYISVFSLWLPHIFNKIVQALILRVILLKHTSMQLLKVCHWLWPSYLGLLCWFFVLKPTFTNDPATSKNVVCFKISQSWPALIHWNTWYGVYQVFTKLIIIWKFNCRLEPIFTTAHAVPKNTTHFKRGYMWLK